MKKSVIFVVLLVLVSCGTGQTESDRWVITVSIAPYSYFINTISGGDFEVNVMVPPGASPHSYEPYPDQLKKLENSLAYIANGYLDFELSWVDKFKDINPRIPFITMTDSIPLLESSHHHSDHGEGENHDHSDVDEATGIDPHIWLSPGNGLVIAREITDFLSMLNPGHSRLYNKNFELLADSIRQLDAEADSLFSLTGNKRFVIYHPNLAYLADDYSLVEEAIEREGKEPSSSVLGELVDIAEEEGIKTVFIQKEFDERYARSIARDLGAEVVVIDPLSENWLGSMKEIIELLYKSMDR